MFFGFNIMILLLGIMLYLFVSGIWKMSSEEGRKNQELIISKSGTMLKFVAIASMAMASINLAFQFMN